MSKMKYRDFNFSAATKQTIATCNEIITEYQQQGFSLTLRQLYYQNVARGYIANKDSEYKKLGSIVNDARLAGLIDWDAIEDRTRNLRSLSTWEDPSSIVSSAAYSYRINKWAPEYQRQRIICMIEKDALIGVIEGVCNELEIPYFSCRGYTSQSEMRSMGQRLLGYQRDGQYPVILHLGDHDASGMDMTRDITERLTMFTGEHVEVIRLALNMEQVELYNCPPNPAKQSDSRYNMYTEKYGEESWELDALSPGVIASLIRESVYSIYDASNWQIAVSREEGERLTLIRASSNWEELAKYIDSQYT